MSVVITIKSVWDTMDLSATLDTKPSQLLTICESAIKIKVGNKKAVQLSDWDIHPYVKKKFQSTSQIKLLGKYYKSCIMISRNYIILFLSLDTQYWLSKMMSGKVLFYELF